MRIDVISYEFTYLIFETLKILILTASLIFTSVKPFFVKTVYLTTSLTNLSLILTSLEFKHGKQSTLIVAQLIE